LKKYWGGRMFSERVFVAMVTEIGFWLGITSSTEVENWREQGKAIKLEKPQALHASMKDSGIGRKQILLSILPIMPGDTLQTEIFVRPTAVEVIGGITDEDGREVCEDERKLFHEYISNFEARMTAVQASKANLVLPTGNMAALSTKLRDRKH
jgi:hypothetical protein